MSAVNAGNIASLTMDAHDAAVILARDKYTAQVAPWRELLRGVSEVKRQSLSQTLVDFCGDLQAVGLLDGAAAMWLLAAFHDEAMGVPA